MICQSRSGKQNASQLLKTDIPSWPFQKISMDISGSNGEIPFITVRPVSVYPFE